MTYAGDSKRSWQLAALEHTGTSLTINGVNNGTTYIVGIRSKNGSGFSGWTNSDSTAPPQPPDRVDSVEVVHNGDSLSVSWNAATRADSYHVTYSDDGKQSWELAEAAHTDTELTINRIDIDKSYVVAVRAKNGGGYSAWRNSDSISAAPGVAYAKVAATMLLVNYPNPFNPETWIPYQLSEAGNASISIYDTAGKLIRTLELGHRSAGLYHSRGRAAHWDGRNDLGERAASGIYFYRLTTPTFHQTRRMLIVK